MWPNPRESFLCGDKFFQAEARLKNYHTKLSYIKPQYNLILKWEFFDSKIKLSHGFISFQRGWTSFFRNSTYLQSNEKKKKKKKNIWKEIKRVSVLKHKTWHHYVCKKKKCLHKKYKDFLFLMIIRAKGW